MRTIRLLLEYDGTAFAGWQAQPEARGRKTVQGVLSRALAEMLQEPVTVRAASRTDAGVHARGQVAAFSTSNTRVPLIGFERGLSSLAGPALVVRRAEEVPAGFNPRHASRGKRYRYSYWNDRMPSALERDRAWFVREPMDLARMADGASRLIGTHDFEAFRSAGCEAAHAVRTMFALEVSRGPHALVYLDVLGNAFCRNMVRIFAGCLRDVAVGRWSAEDVSRVLAARDRRLGGMTAPPHGLCLEEVIYDDRLPPRPEKHRARTDD